MWVSTSIRGHFELRPSPPIHSGLLPTSPIIVKWPCNAAGLLIFPLSRIHPESFLWVLQNQRARWWNQLQDPFDRTFNFIVTARDYNATFHFSLLVLFHYFSFCFTNDWFWQELEELKNNNTNSASQWWLSNVASCTSGNLQSVATWLKLQPKKSESSDQWFVPSPVPFELASLFHFFIYLLIYLFLLFTISFENDPSHRPELTEDKLALCWAQNWAQQITVLWTDCEPIGKIDFSTNHTNVFGYPPLHALLRKWYLKFKQKPNDPSQTSVCWKDGIWTLRRSLIYGWLTASVLYLFGLEELPFSGGTVETFLK